MGLKRKPNHRLTDINFGDSKKDSLLDRIHTQIEAKRIMLTASKKA